MCRSLDHARYVRKIRDVKIESASVCPARLTLEDQRLRRAEILRIGKFRRASRIAVFGSVAMGEAREDSDLDVLVDFDEGASLVDHAGLFQDLETLLGVRVDVVSRRALRTSDERIRAEAVEL